MATISVSDGDDGDDSFKLTEEQRAALANAIFTPEFQRSLAAQMEPVLAVSRASGTSRSWRTSSRLWFK